MTRLDVLVLLIIVILYSVTAFFDLGDTVAPQTSPKMQANGDEAEYITYIDFGKKTDIDCLMLYKGLGRCIVTAYYADMESGEWVKLGTDVCDDVFVWHSIVIDVNTRQMCLALHGSSNLELYEAGFIGADGEIVAADADGCLLFDEQELVQSTVTYRNGMIFDEKYHARTAYEHTEGMEPYEISHPPLGKLLISLGIGIFGMNPFGWRFMGTLFGVAMIAVMYVLAKRIFKNTCFASAAALLFAFDFMHFTQTRTALIDSFAVFFILLMTGLMYIYYDSTTEELPYKKSLKLLAVCGVAFGLGISSKWTAVYAGIGLAVLFAIAIVRRAKEGEKPLPTCLWCLLFFVAIPLVIYFLSYIPYYIAYPDESPFKVFWENQKYMLTYHGGLADVHPFESKWYTWPVIYRPIWYYGSKELAYEGLCSTIVAFGNPIVWWGGSLASVILLFKPKKTGNEAFILIALLSQLLPWALISRSTFIYHFFASVPFIILAMTSVLKSLCEKWRRMRLSVPILLAAAAVMFVMFYPVLSGAVASRGYVTELLSWFESWTLCY